MIGGYLGQRPTLVCQRLGGYGGMPPPGNFENAYSGRCIFLVLGAKSRAFRTDFYQVTGNKVTMNWSVDC